MKPYQHHDEYHDIGKAEPHPKRPTTYGSRKPFTHTHAPKKINGVMRCKIDQDENGKWFIVK